MTVHWSASLSVRLRRMYRPKKVTKGAAIAAKRRMLWHWTRADEVLSSLSPIALETFWLFINEAEKHHD